MAKKLRHHTWWFPVFTKEVETIRKNKAIGSIESGELPILFNEKMVAYGYAVGRRMDVKRDDNGDVITNDKGYGQLQDHGKITLIGIKGDQIDWKRASVIDKPSNVKGIAIAASYNVPVNKQTLKTVFEESDEMYNRYATTPLAKAGGLEAIETDTHATETVPSEA
jgi:hypothetical protein